MEEEDEDQARRESGRLSYLKGNQIRLRKVRRRKSPLTFTKEIGTVTNPEDSNLIPQPPPVNEVKGQEEKEITPSIEELPSPIFQVAGQSLVNSQSEHHDSQNLSGPNVINVQPPVEEEEVKGQNVVPLQSNVKESPGLNLPGPVKLRPVFPEWDDMRYLLNLTREKGLNTLPPWQREGTARINEVLHNLNPITTPLVAISFPLQVETPTTSGSAKRLIQIYFWLAGLTISSLQPRAGADYASLIYQLRTPLRRIQKLNADLQTILHRPFKKVRRWIKPLAKELNEEVYQYILRMTPLPKAILILDKFNQHQQSETTASRRSRRLQRHLLITSFSTVVVISGHQEPNLRSRKVIDLSPKSAIYVIQGILSGIEMILKKIKLGAEALERGIESRIGAATKISFKKLVQHLKCMRTERGLRYVTTTRRLAESLKSLEIEVNLLVRVIDDILEHVAWIDEVIDLVLREAEVWTPHFLHQKLRLRRKRVWHLRDCYKRQVESSRTFDQIFPLHEFGKPSDSFQVKVQMRSDRMEYLFHEPLRQLDINVNMNDPLTVTNRAEEPDDEVKLVSEQSSEVMVTFTRPSTTPVHLYEAEPPPVLIF